MIQWGKPCYSITGNYILEYDIHVLYLIHTSYNREAYTLYVPVSISALVHTFTLEMPCIGKPWLAKIHETLKFRLQTGSILKPFLSQKVTTSHFPTCFNTSGDRSFASSKASWPFAAPKNDRPLVCATPRHVLVHVGGAKRRKIRPVHPAMFVPKIPSCCRKCRVGRSFVHHDVLQNPWPGTLVRDSVLRRNE